MTTIVDEAYSHLEIAYKLLEQENLSERFFPLAVNISKINNSHFFYQFQSESGMLLSIERNSTGELVLSVTVRRVSVSFLKKCWIILLSAWAQFRGKETIYNMHLADEDVTKFKDLLRNIR